MNTQDAVARAFRAERLAGLATVIRLTDDWELAEECLQDAFEGGATALAS